MDLGKAISTIRKRKRITQKELAGKCDLSVAALSNIEKGKILPSHEMLDALVEGMGIQAADLLLRALDDTDGNLVKESLSMKRLKP